MTGWIPWRWKQSVRDALGSPRRRKWMAARRTMGLTPAPAHQPVLDFGFEPGGPGFVHGGKVKLLHLQEAFACDPATANLLYLVSSAIPDAAADYVPWARERGARLVWNQNGVAYPAWAGKESERFNGPMRQLRELASIVIYQSEFCRISAERFLGPCDVPGRVLLNPVDLERFSPSGDLAPQGKLRLLAAGTHGYRERVISVIDCLEALRSDGMEAELTVAGRFEWPGAEDELQELVSRKKLQTCVRRIGAFNQSEAPELYRGHDLLLHPKYMDPCPTVVAEALACGLPVVGSDSGGLPEMTNPDCSRLLPVEQDWEQQYTPAGRDLAAAVLSLVPDLEGGAKAARQCALEKFSASKWIRVHAEVFAGVLKEGHV